MRARVTFCWPEDTDAMAFGPRSSSCAIILAEPCDDRSRLTLVVTFLVEDALMPARSNRTDRMGILPPRYAFFLNPYPNERFTRCPRCKAAMRLRKIPLVIHVDPFGLMLLRKTCRLCVACEMLIAHEAEVSRVIDGFAARADVKTTYLVLGTLGSGTWREGMRGGVTIDDVKHDMADFKMYMRVEITPRHWSQTSEPGTDQGNGR